MSYIKDLIAKNRAESAEYRAAYDEELELAERERARREAVMRRVTAARKAAHMTQRDLAEALGISQARVSQLERGEEILSVDRLLEMLPLLGVRMAILTEEDALRHGLEGKIVGEGFTSAGTPKAPSISVSKAPGGPKKGAQAA